MTIRQLGRSEIRHLATTIGWRPCAERGQYFLHDFLAVRRVATASGAHKDHVLEVGPGMGSLTLALLGKGAQVTAIESDPVLARQLPRTIAEHTHNERQRLSVLHRDVMTVHSKDVTGEPTILVANLPSNVAEASLLHLLSEFPSLRTVLVLTDWALADRLAAEPGHPKYHPTGAKLRLYGTVHRYGTVSPAAFWPIPRTPHGLILLDRDQPHRDLLNVRSRAEVFDLIDIAFARRRISARNAFAEWAGSGRESAKRLLMASIDPARRADDLTVEDFTRLQRSADASANTGVDHRRPRPASATAVPSGTCTLGV